MKRNRNRGEKYWNEKGFPKTNFETEVKKLIEKKIKVHSYYLNPYQTAGFFKKLSADTHGTSEQFKINDKDATKMFADFVADKVIKNLGDIIGGDSKEKMLKRYAEMSKNNKKKYV